MRQIEIAICDDQEYYLEQLFSLLNIYQKESNYDFHIRKYLDGKKLLEEYKSKENELDLVFLDVDMPGINGVDVAHHLRRNGYEGIICFVTSYDQYAIDAYGVEAMGYLLKPAQYSQLKRMLEHAVIQIFYKLDKEEAQKRYLEIDGKRSVVTVDLEKVLYFEKRRNQCVIHLEDGELVCYDTLKNIYERLNQVKFCYAHQGYIVNFDKIKEVGPDYIAFGDNREIPVSRKYQKGLSERHMDLIHRLQRERITKNS